MVRWGPLPMPPAGEAAAGAGTAAEVNEAGRDVNRREAGISGALSAATAASTSSELNDESSVCDEPERRVCACACEAAAEAEAGHDDEDCVADGMIGGVK